MTISIPVLDDRSYAQLVAEARSRVPVHTPEWTNLNESDPGVTLLELFAYLTDNLLYRSNRIPEANRLKFLSMLGVPLQPASSGVGLVTVTNEKASPDPLPIQAGTELRAGQVRFVTDTPVDVLPVSAAVFYKQPQQLNDAELERYRLLYQTFLASDTDALTFYRPVALEAPATGKPDPVVDLGDPVNGTIDRSLWIALLAQKDLPLAVARQRIADRTLSIGVYPTASVPGQVLLPERTGTVVTDPGLVVEIAAPSPDPNDPTGATGFGLGPANYYRLPTTYAESVLDAPGLIHVTLPPYEKLLLWDFDPEEEGTGDYPPRIDDPKISSRLVTWVRLRYPPLPDQPAASDDDPEFAIPTGSARGRGCTGSSAPKPLTTPPDDGEPDCGCGPTAAELSALTSTDSVAAAPATAATPAAPASSGCEGCGEGQSMLGGPALLTNPHTLPGRITWVGVNATRAVQAVAVVEELVGYAPGTPYHVATLAHTPVLTTALPTGGRQAVTLEVQNLAGTWEDWEQTDDILAAGPEEPVYTLDPAAGTITFGSGLHGLRPTRGARIRASYWYGGGLEGQVPVGAIDKSIALPGGFTIANPLPTWGAGAGESAAEGEAAITRWLRHRDRLVTVDDFRDLTRRTPGIDLGRVEVLPLFHPEAPGAQDWPGVVTVLVVPRADPAHPSAPVPDRQFLDAVCGWLAPRRLVTTEVHVRGPVYVPVWVSIAVVPLPGFLPSLVHQAVTQAVTTFLSPLTGGLPTEPAEDGLVGEPGVIGGGWPLGVNVRTQDIEAVATRVPGVRYVEGVRLAVANPEGAITSTETVQLTGLRIPQAIVHCGAPPLLDATALIAGSQAVAPTLVAVPFVPETC